MSENKEKNTEKAVKAPKSNVSSLVNADGSFDLSLLEVLPGRAPRMGTIEKVPGKGKKGVDLHKSFQRNKYSFAQKRPGMFGIKSGDTIVSLKPMVDVLGNPLGNCLSAEDSAKAISWLKSLPHRYLRELARS